MKRILPSNTEKPLTLPRRFITSAGLIERRLFSNPMALWRARTKRGFPEPFNPGERTLVWDEDEVAEWLASRRGVPPPKPGRKAAPRRESYGASYSSGNP
jgi:predicted DNA-binding transcriptional regulator AlpA